MIENEAYNIHIVQYISIAPNCFEWKSEKPDILKSTRTNLVVLNLRYSMAAPVIGQISERCSEIHPCSFNKFQSWASGCSSQGAGLG